MEWTKCEPMKNGDKFTVHGEYKKRTLWQWLTKKPRVLQEYVVFDEAPANGITVIISR